MKEVKDLYSENYKSLKTGIEEDIRGWKDLPCSWMGRINTVKMTILQKTIYISMHLHQNPNDILHRD
jgi:hypothetical protein